MLTKMNIKFIFVTFLYAVNILEINGTAETGSQLLPLPVPVSPDHVTWNSRILHSIPPIHTWINRLKNEDAISEPCRQHLQLYSDEYNNLTTWALEMFDASTKIPESVASGTYYHLGNFDQCLAVKAYDDDDVHVFNGQYCGQDTHLFDEARQFDLRLRFAACIPSTCTAADLQELLLSLILPLEVLLNVNVEVSVEPINCYIEGDKEPLSAGSWVVISIFVILAIDVAVCALLDHLNIKFSNEKVNSTIKAFSLKKNWLSLLKTEQARGSITCMHGIRVCSLFWIIIGHRYGTERDLPKINMSDFNKIYDDVSMQLVLNSIPAVDTFFIMSGLLVSFLTMKDLSRGNKFNPFIYYVHRYFRLTTSYAMVIAFYATLYGDIGYGPLWRPAVTLTTERCKDTWWTGILYVDNFVNWDKYYDILSAGACVGQGWYLACDMQYAWAAPLILLPLFYWFKWASKGLFVLILASCFAPFTYAYLHNYFMYSHAFDTPLRRFEYYSGYYTVSYMRASSYLVGICVGYFMYKNQKELHIPKWLVVCGWMTSTVIALTIILSPTIMYQPGYEYDRVGCAFYNGFHRLGWSLVIAWIIVACHYGYGGPINKLLSWGGWLPFSKLSYCTYLTHLYIVYQDSLQIRTTGAFSHYSAVQKYCGDLILSTMLSVVLYMLVECPTLGLLQTFLKKPRAAAKPVEPKTEVPKTEVPKTEVPNTEAPKIETPKGIP